MNGRHLKNPYPGLRPFEQEDSDFFFGRETHTEELLRRLSSSRFVAVVGTSGSGKSSLVRAGLVPALYGDLLAAGSHWRVAIFRPGDDPIRAMADELHKNISVVAGAADGKLPRDMLETTLRRSSLGLVEAIKQTQLNEKENLLVVVDQFEELFRFQDRAGTSGAKDESAAFVKLLLEGAANTAVPVYALITMRSDFLGDCARFRELPEAVNKGLYLVPRLTRDQLREAIEGPAAVAGGKVSPALVERLLNEIGDDQDQLPVLQHALMRTWRPSGTMGLEEYEATGGMEKALSKHADEALSKFSTGEQIDLVRKVFQCITEKGPDKREVRRPTQFRDIRAICGNASDSEVKEIIEWFRAPGRSFLMPPDLTPIRDDTFIDISHESLIRKWETLKRWVDEEAESADTYRRLAQSAELYTKGQEGLLRDPGLQLTLEQKEKGQWNEDWGKRYAKNYSVVLDFLEKSRQARESEVKETEKQRRKQLNHTRAFAAVLLVAAVFAAVVVTVLVRQRQFFVNQGKANRQLLYVANMNLAAKAFEEAKPSIGNEILNRYLPTSGILQQYDPRSFYWYFLWRMNHHELVTLKGHEGSVLSVAFSNNGKTVARGSSDGTVKVWDVATRQELSYLPVGFREQVLSVAFSPDGKTVAIGSSGGSVELWDVATRETRGSLYKPHSPRLQHVLSVAFSKDGKTVAIGSSDGIVQLWDVATRKELGTLKGHEGSVLSVALSPDGKTVASGSLDSTVKLWEVATRKEISTLKGHGGSVLSVAFSPDGKTVATGSRDGIVRLWDIATRRELGTLKRHEGSVLSVAFSPDGKTVAAGSRDGIVQLWDVATRKEISTLKGHGGSVLSVAFSPDGKTVASGSEDSTVKLWDVAIGQEVVTLKGHEGSVLSAALSPDGKTVATGSREGIVRLWDVATRRELGTLKGHGGSVLSVAFSPDGKTVASGSEDSTVKLWDVATRRELGTLKANWGSVLSAAFSPDGKTVAIGSSGGSVELWDVATRETRGSLYKPHSPRLQHVLSVAFSKDGKTVAIGSSDGNVQLWDVATRKEIGDLHGHGGGILHALSNDGKTVAIGSSDGNVQLWDVATRQELGTLIGTLKGNGERVFSIAFSPDGKTVAIGSSERTVQLWDVETSQELGTLKGHGGSVLSVVFSNDGKTLASGSLDNTVKLWEAATEKKVAAQR